MEFENVLYEKDGGVLRITMNRPAAFNSMNIDLMSDLLGAFAAADADPGVRAVILTGSGKAFCAGGDIASFRENITGINAYIKRLTISLHGAVSRMARLQAPVIAAVNGVAAGAGMGMVLAPDLAIATESAKFNMAYTGIGASPDGSTTFFLPRAVGVRRAMELAMLNRVLSAEEALDWGIVNRVVPDDKFEDEVDKFARQLAAGPTRAYAHVKKLMNTSLDNSLETQMENEAYLISAAAATEDFDEATKAFIEKRKPIFKGK